MLILVNQLVCAGIQLLPRLDKLFHYEALCPNRNEIVGIYILYGLTLAPPVPSN